MTGHRPRRGGLTDARRAHPQPAVLHAAHARRRRRPPLARVHRRHAGVPVATGGRGLGVEYRLGTLDEINGTFPTWAAGEPFEFRPARAFVVNVPAAKAMALGEVASIPDPAADEILALWRKCPHLGCMIPKACEEPQPVPVLLPPEHVQHPRREARARAGAARDGPLPGARSTTPASLIVDTREIVKGPPQGNGHLHRSASAGRRMLLMRLGSDDVELADRLVALDPPVAERRQVERLVAAGGDPLCQPSPDGWRLLEPVAGEPVGEQQVRDAPGAVRRSRCGRGC